MKLILKNKSDDLFSYLNGAVVLQAGDGNQIDVPSKHWYPLLMDATFMKDMKFNNFVVSDGLEDLMYPESKNHLIDLVSVISNKDSDGSPLNRTKITASGWHYQLHGVEFTTSKLNSVESKKADGTDWNFCTMKFYKLENGNEIEITGQDLTQEYLDINCIKTIIDWEPTFDVDIIGGILKQVARPTNYVDLWVVGAPDVPAAYGGSKEFVSNLDLEFVDKDIAIDGKTPKTLIYSPIYHSNKIRLIFRHPAGYKHNLHMIFEIFKA